MVVTVGHGIISQPASQPSEQTALLLKKNAYRSDVTPRYGTSPGVPAAGTIRSGPFPDAISTRSPFKRMMNSLYQELPSSAALKKGATWRGGALEILGFVPPVILGLLLNVLDALSYGKDRDTVA